MAYTIDSDSANIVAVNLTQQASDPAAPAASHWKLYCKSGGLYLEKSDGTITGPFAAATSGAVAQIQKQTVTGSVAANITFNTGLSGYNELRLVVTGRGDAVATFENLYMQINADTGANYDFEYGQNNGSTTSSAEGLAQTFAFIGWIPAASAPSNVAGSSEVRFPDYTDTTWQRTYLAQSGLKLGTSTGNLYRATIAGWWRSTAAITTSIKIYPASGNFAIGTVAILYGVT